ARASKRVLAKRVHDGAARLDEEHHDANGESSPQRRFGELRLDNGRDRTRDDCGETKGQDDRVRRPLEQVFADVGVRRLRDEHQSGAQRYRYQPKKMDGGEFTSWT